MQDRYGVACCWDCGTMLRKGEGTVQTRGSERNPRKRMVCRDREECEYRRSLFLTRRQERVQ